MKMDQIAFYCATEKAEQYVKRTLGLSDAVWIKDTVTAEAYVAGHKTDQINVAELQFCYDLGTELEILRYIAGPHWLMHKWQSQPFISHIGFHVHDWPDMENARLVQEVFKTSHTNPELVKNGKTYQYRIYEIGPATYWKFIKRVMPK